MAGISEKQSPIYLLSTIIFTIFFAEIAVMFFISFLPPLSKGLEAFVDSSLLIAIIFPILYFFVCRPFISYISERKRSEEKLLQQARAATLSANISLALIRDDSLQNILHLCTEVMVRNLEVSLAQVWLLNEAENILELQAGTGINTHTNGSHSRIPVGKFKIGRIAQDRQPILTNSVIDDPDSHGQEWAKHEKLVAFAGYPLIVESKLVGVMAMFSRKPLAETYFNVLNSTARAIALGIERKRAKELTERQEEQLFQADKMASLGVMISGVAHEINNPNNFIMFNSSMLVKFWKDIMPILEERWRSDNNFKMAGLSYEETCEAIPELLSGISDGSKRIKAIVDKLKNFSRQNEPSINEEVYINEVVDRSILIVRSTIEKATRRFEFQREEILPPVIGSRQELEQVIVNLLTNACQALANRNDAIKISTIYNKKSDWVVLRVEDEGVGIPVENIGKVTQPFFTTKRNSGGTGLGLSVSFGIVKNHRGKLELSSEEGKGTVVNVILPSASL